MAHWARNRTMTALTDPPRPNEPGRDSNGRASGRGRGGVLLIVGPFSAGGVSRRASDLAGSLARTRPVTILTWTQGLLPRREITAEGVWIVRVPSLLRWDRDHHPLAAALNTVVSLLTGAAAAAMLGRRWTVAHAMGLHPEGTLAALVARARRRFVLTTWLVGPFGNAARLHRSPSRRLVLPLLRRATWIAPETADAADELVGLGLPTERLTIIDAGVDLTRFRPRRGEAGLVGKANEGRPRIAIYAGRFDLRQKLLYLLLDAWEAANLNDWKLILIGGGHDETAVRRRAQGTRGARVLGWQQDVAPLLAGADLFVLPTVAEGSPLALLEGMACGVPGLVSAIPGLAARQPDGVLLVENDVGAWSDALRQIDALGPGERRALGDRARAWVETHGDVSRSHARWAEVLS
jgi:glycosyltransferase involved in cell wall biosynthesis